MASKKTEKSKGGRPSLLTPALIETIVANIEKGAFPMTSALAAGISERTWYGWLAKGRDGDADYVQLLQAVERARGRLASRLYHTIIENAVGTERVVRDGKGNVVQVDKDGNVCPAGVMGAPLMERVPGNWTAAARALESLVAGEFKRNFGTTNDAPDGAAPDPEGKPSTAPFTVVHVSSDRPEKEMTTLDRKVQQAISSGT